VRGLYRTRCQAMKNSLLSVCLGKLLLYNEEFSLPCCGRYGGGDTWFGRRKQDYEPNSWLSCLWQVFFPLRSKGSVSASFEGQLLTYVSYAEVDTYPGPCIFLIDLFND
jgi:hypothetical protein